MFRSIDVGSFRSGPMSVVSGTIGKERIHFQAPKAELVQPMMVEFLNWFNGTTNQDQILRAGIVHLWFLTIHPFDDGNGRIARAITELLLWRSDQSSKRFYSLASYILAHRKQYYLAIEWAQKGTPDITQWLVWFLDVLAASLASSEEAYRKVLDRTVFWRDHEDTIFNQRQRRMLTLLPDGLVGNLTTGKMGTNLQGFG